MGYTVPLVPRYGIAMVPWGGTPCIPYHTTFMSDICHGTRGTPEGIELIRGHGGPKGLNCRSEDLILSYYLWTPATRRVGTTAIRESAFSKINACIRNDLRLMGLMLSLFQHLGCSEMRFGEDLTICCSHVHVEGRVGESIIDYTDTL